MREPYRTMFDKLDPKSQHCIEKMIKLASQEANANGQWTTFKGNLTVKRIINIGDSVDI